MSNRKLTAIYPHENVVGKLDKIIELLLADREERQKEKELKQSADNDARLIEYAKAKKKLMPTGDS